MLAAHVRRATLATAACCTSSAVLAKGTAPLAQSTSAGDKHKELQVFSSSPKARKAIVIGAGVIGTCTAFELAKQGFSVAVIDSAAGPGKECSACAAGGMQRSNPLTNRASWLDVIKASLGVGGSSGGPGGNYRFFHISPAVLADPHFWRWIASFTYNSLAEPKRQAERQRHMLAFTDWAVSEMAALIKERGIECGYSNSGALQLLYDDRSHVSGGGKAQTTLERHTLVSLQRALELEPSLVRQKVLPTYGRFEPDAAMGNSEALTRKLAEICVADPSLDVNFVYNCRLEGWDTETGGADSESDGKRRISRLRTRCGSIDVQPGTEVVVAAGSWTPKLLAPLGIYVPVYPLKGYCISFQLPPLGSPTRPPEAELPQRIVFDKYVYTSRLGNEVRVTSVGEFNGWSTQPTPEVDAAFREQAVLHMPQLASFLEGTPTRCGLRPFTTDGIIICGRVEELGNLSVNVGPGFNGWKIALGAGRVIADTLQGKSFDTFDAAALSPLGRVRSSPAWSKFTLLAAGKGDEALKAEPA